MTTKRPNIFYYIPLKNTTKLVIAGPKGNLMGGMTTKCLNISRRRKKNWKIFLLFLKYFYKKNSFNFKRGSTKLLTIRYKGAPSTIKDIFFIRKMLFRFFLARGLKPQSFEFMDVLRQNGCRTRKRRR